MLSKLRAYFGDSLLVWLVEPAHPERAHVAQGHRRTCWLLGLHSHTLHQNGPFMTPEDPVVRF
jgi:hypothetical protein